MSGGELIVLDRNGRDVKRYSLPDGLATIGSDPACDICVMLASVSSHHATIVVHTNQTIIRNVGDGDTLVNGENISVSALDHGDVITLGDRSLRWEYTNPSGKRNRQIQPAFLSSVRAGVGITGSRRRRTGRRGSASAGAAPVNRAVQLAIEMSHRASMPASSGGKQVAVVQPQRRDNNSNAQSDKTLQIQSQSSKRSRSSNMETPLTDEDRCKRKSNTKSTSKNATLQGTTKATLWIESRKTSPKKSTKQSPARACSASRLPVATSTLRTPSLRTSSLHTPSLRTPALRTPALRTPALRTPALRTPASRTPRDVIRNKSMPLRMTVLRKAQSAQKLNITKIEEPVKIDETKQAAIMLMTGHAAKSKLVASKPKTPSYVLKKPSPVRRAPRVTSTRSRRSKDLDTPLGSTPRRPSAGANTRASQNQSTSALEISNTDTKNVTVRRSKTPRRSRPKSPKKSPLQLNPKKSALKDPKKLSRKSESIKFDLSNLKNNSQDCSEMVTVTDTSAHSVESDCGVSDDLTLRYSDSPTSTSPSPRQPIHSRSSRILEKSIGVYMSLSPRHTVQVNSSNTKKSTRGSLIVQKALEMPSNDTTFRGSTDSTNQSASIASAFKTHTLSPRSNANMESYSIVDLVSIDSNESRSASLYNSVTSEDNTSFETPQTSIGRKTRSTLDPTLIGSSTPYVAKTSKLSNYSQNVTRHGRSHSNLEVSQQSNHTITDLTSTRRSKSLSTPENTQKHISVNSTKISRPSRSRSRLNDSDLMLIDENENDASPKSSKRINRTSKSIQYDSTTQDESFIDTNAGDPSSTYNGITTPENSQSLQDVGTPVLRIQSLLESSQNSFTSQNSSTRSGRLTKKKTTGTIVIAEPKKGSPDFRPKSRNMSTRKTKLNLTKDFSGSDISDEGATQSDNEQIVTPKSDVKLIPEAVKNKHSTAKKPQSKRSIIDDLNQSDIVKQLFNSPVKRKLSQSMTEFSRKRLFEDDEEVTPAKRPTRNTVAYIPVTCEDSVLDRTEAITPELFVSPINTPRHSPNMTGIKRLFAKTSPENNLNDLRGVKVLLGTPRTRRSVKNDLTNVSGVKLIFAKSPENRLSDVSVKNVFVKSPRNDLRRVTGVKTLFRQQKESKESKNDLSDVRGVRKLFRNNPTNDLRNVSGVKRMLQHRSPRNDLTDVRGVRKIFRQEKQTDECNVSGVEELFDESRRDTELLFDRLIGKPRIKSVYSKTFSSRSAEIPRNRSSKTLHTSIDDITNNVEEWLENELQRRANKERSANNSLRRELRKLATDTVEGTTPIRASRVRDATLVKGMEGEEQRSSASLAYSARRLPIKKRSLGDRSVENAKLDKYTLPIKKRRVVHSTPVKNNVTINPSDLSRVSPIQAITTTSDTTTPRQYNTAHRSTIEMKEVSTHQAKTKTVKEKDVTSNSEVKVSPRKTRAKANATKTSPAVRRTRTRAGNKLALLINKKTPGLTPQASEKGKTVAKNNTIDINENKHVSPIKKSQKQKRVQLDVESPPKRSTRAKKEKTEVIVNKPPVRKPRASKKVSFKDSNVLKSPVTLQEINVKAKRTRNTVPTSQSATKIQALNKKTETKKQSKSKNNDVQTKNTEDIDQNPPVRQNRKNVAKSVMLEDNEKPIKVNPVKARKRNKSPDAEINLSDKLAEAKPMRTRRRGQAVETQEVVSVKVTASKNVKTKIHNQEIVQSTKTASSRLKNTHDTVATETRGRTYRTIVQEPEPEETTRGRRKTVKVMEESTSKQKQSVVKESKVKINTNKQPDGETVSKTTRTARSKKAVEQVSSAKDIEQKQVRQKRGGTVAESEPEPKRKRRNNSKTSSLKESAKKQIANKRVAAADSPAVVAPGRATRRTTKGNDHTEVITQRRGRARAR